MIAIVLPYLSLAEKKGSCNTFAQTGLGLLSVGWVKPNLGRKKQYCCLGRAPASAMPEFVLSCLSLNEKRFSVQEVKGFIRSHSQKCLPD